MAGRTKIYGTEIRSGSIPTFALSGGVVSSSTQVLNVLPAGIVSSSTQVSSNPANNIFLAQNLGGF